MYAGGATNGSSAVYDVDGLPAPLAGGVPMMDGHSIANPMYGGEATWGDDLNLAAGSVSVQIV